MKSREVFIVILLVTAMWHSAIAKPKRGKIEPEAPPLQRVLSGANAQSNAVLSGLITFKPEMPLGPQDLLKSYEIAMSLVADKTSTDFSVIVQAQQENQITREQAEYLLQQKYELAIMQYQVLSALHDVLRHDMEEATQRRESSLRTARADTVLVVPCPSSALGCR